MSRNPALELEAMTDITAAIKKLADDTEAKRRVLQWAISAFLADGTTAPSALRLPATANSNAPAAATTNSAASFSTVADLYSAASPSGDAERALVVGFWFQSVGGENDVDGFQVNRELKHLGHGVANITQAFNGLIARRPQLAIQTRKSGNSQQARKRYKLTMEGIRAVEKMLMGEKS